MRTETWSHGSVARGRSSGQRREAGAWGNGAMGEWVWGEMMGQRHDAETRGMAKSPRDQAGKRGWGQRPKP